MAYEDNYQSSILDTNDLQSKTPQQIASYIFNSEAKDPCTIQIIADEDHLDISYIFEILISILMEGFQILNNDLYSLDLDNLTEESFEDLNPWFKSIGFKIRCNKYPLDDEDYKELYDKYYCNIVINNPLNEVIFIAKNIKEPFHFFLNGDSMQKYENETQLCNFYAIIKSSNNVYKINFDFYQLPINHSIKSTVL